MKRLIYKNPTQSQIIVFRLGTTTNKKISASKKKKIVQQYTFSFEQVKNPKKFYLYDAGSCYSCKYRQNNGCYVTKPGPQRFGLIAMLKSIKKVGINNLPVMPSNCPEELIKMCDGKYIRFGTYGEPIAIPINWLPKLTGIAKTFTGYTHEWKMDEMQLYKHFFMASTDTPTEFLTAQAFGWRCFNVIDNEDNQKDILANLVNCPASEESGKKTSCDRCQLCQGTAKKAKSVFIYKH